VDRKELGAGIDRTRIAKNVSAPDAGVSSADCIVRDAQHLVREQHDGEMESSVQMLFNGLLAVDPDGCGTPMLIVNLCDTNFPGCVQDVP
jgi:hypothetical protein